MISMVGGWTSSAEGQIVAFETTSGFAHFIVTKDALQSRADACDLKMSLWRKTKIMMAEEVTEGHNPGEASQPGTQQAR